MKNLLEYRAVIFDVDGTLYFQPRLRALMAVRLLLHVARHPGRFRDLKILSTFRAMREKLETVEGEVESVQYQMVADRLSRSPAEVRTVVEKWMHAEPLAHLRSCRDEELAGIIRELHKHGITTIAYSDYPAVAKLAALDVRMDHVFCATDPQINCLKPNPQGLRVILAQLSLAAQDCLFIGDRHEKDGLCAERAGMDYVILRSGRAARKRTFQKPPLLLR